MRIPLFVLLLVLVVRPMVYSESVSLEFYCFASGDDGGIAVVMLPPVSRLYTFDEVIGAPRIDGLGDASGTVTIVALNESEALQIRERLRAVYPKVMFGWSQPKGEEKVLKATNWSVKKDG